MSLTPEQKKLRRSGIGGSDAAAIMGLSKWNTALDIYLEKLSTEDPYDDVSNSFMEWGNNLEPLIVRQFEKVTGNQCLIVKDQFRHPDHNFMLANIDAKLANENALLECKAVFSWYSSKEWGEVGSDQIPEHYLIQCAHYAEVLDVDKVYIAVLLFGHDFRVYQYNRNRILGNALIDKEKYFWHEHVLKGIPPTSTDINDSIKLYAHLADGSSRVAGRRIENCIKEMKLIKTQAKMLNEAYKERTKEIYNAMQEAEYLNDEQGNNLASWKLQNSNRLDINLLKSEMPEVYNKYLRQSKARVLKLKGQQPEE